MDRPHILVLRLPDRLADMYKYDNNVDVVLIFLSQLYVGLNNVVICNIYAPYYRLTDCLPVRAPLLQHSRLQPSPLSLQIC